jgi:murein hydrolase activator
VSTRRHNPKWWRRLAAIAVAAGLAAATMPARTANADSDTKQTLEKVQRDLKGAQARRERLRREAEANAVELSGLKRKLVSAARRAQDHEARVSALERRVAALRAEQRDKSTVLRNRRRQMIRMLAALQRLARHPPVALIVLPASPTDTVRSAILLRGAVPRIEAQAARLKLELSQLAALRSNIALEREQLAAAGKALGRERRDLALLIDRKLALERRAKAESSAARSRISKLASQARNLRDLMNRLAANRRARARNVPRVQRTPATPSTGRMPAQGRIVQRFRGSGPSSKGRKGITIETRPAASVVAPGNGEIVFAGPFRGYGQLLIIEHGGGYHVLLAGLSRVDAVVGDEVLEGEPVGVMGSSSGLKPKLYFELRRNGRPVNPLPWLAARKDKVSG